MTARPHRRLPERRIAKEGRQLWLRGAAAAHNRPKPIINSKRKSFVFDLRPPKPRAHALQVRAAPEAGLIITILEGTLRGGLRPDASSMSSMETLQPIAKRRRATSKAAGRPAIRCSTRYSATSRRRYLARYPAPSDNVPRHGLCLAMSRTSNTTVSCV